MALANVFFTRIITGLGGSIFQQILACRWEFHEQRFQHPGGVSAAMSLAIGASCFNARWYSHQGNIHVSWDAFLLVLQKKKREVEMEKEAGRPSWGWPWKKFFVLLDPSFS